MVACPGSLSCNSALVPASRKCFVSEVRKHVVWQRLQEQGRLLTERVFISVKICLVCSQTDNWCWLQLEWFHHGLFLESGSAFDYAGVNSVSVHCRLRVPDHWRRNHFLSFFLKEKGENAIQWWMYLMSSLSVVWQFCDCSLLLFQNGLWFGYKPDLRSVATWSVYSVDVFNCLVTEICVCICLHTVGVIASGWEFLSVWGCRFI